MDAARDPGEKSDEPNGLSNSMMAQRVEWHGTKAEADDLMTALTRNCTCMFSEDTGATVSQCAGHEMLLKDQRALDWLLFCRRNVAILRGEEGVPSGQSGSE